MLSFAVLRLGLRCLSTLQVDGCQGTLPVRRTKKLRCAGRPTSEVVGLLLPERCAEILYPRRERSLDVGGHDQVDPFQFGLGGVARAGREECFGLLGDAADVGLAGAKVLHGVKGRSDVSPEEAP